MLQIEHEQVLCLLQSHFPEVSESVGETLTKYLNLLIQWNRGTNLIRFQNSEELLHDHLADSFHLVPWVRKLQPSRWYDIGSGGGFPAIPTALLAEYSGALTLIESRQKKAAFLTYVARSLRSEERRVGKECRSRWSPYH